VGYKTLGMTTDALKALNEAQVKNTQAQLANAQNQK
jgi:hypothetical protein